MNFDRELPKLHGGEARGSAECLAELAVQNKPGYLPKAIAGRKTDQHGSAPGYQAGELVGRQVEILNTVQPGKIGECSIEQLPPPQLGKMLCRQNLKLDGRFRVFAPHAS